VFVLVGYLLLAPPVLVFGPLAGLLLLAGPRTAREWLWLLATGTSSVLWLNQSGGLAGQFTRAGAVLLTGTFLALTLWRPSARFARVLISTTVAGLALVAWMWHMGVGWFDLQHAVEQDLWRANSELIMRLGQPVAGGGTQLLDEMSAMARTIGSLYPALLMLASLAGLRLAWAWHHRISSHPIGPPPTTFATFRFSDQFVWGWVLGLALCLSPLPKAFAFVGANVLLVVAGLYATRGLAVFSAGSGRVPGPVMAAITVVAMFLLPFVVGGLTLLGLADTWLDFRRRLAPSAT
jgi:hypothetical protein